MTPAFQWVIPPPDAAAQSALIIGLGLHPITAAVLVARGLRSEAAARTALSGDDLSPPDPFLLDGMEQAADRVYRAVRNRESILVYGDYDVDGMCATAVYVEFFKILGQEASYYIPLRLSEGYGLNADVIRRLAASGVSLLITVDCGTTAVDEIALARSLGMDVIVTDHHVCESSLPPAFAILNPCRPDSSYPFTGLCSAALAYKFTTAYARKYGIPLQALDKLLDLVTLATIADMVPLHAENRRMVQRGLSLLSSGERVGLRALKAVAQVHGACTVGAVSFRLAPRLNAAGRLGDATEAVRLLLSTDEEEAWALAQMLDRTNGARQQIEEQVMAEAVAAVETRAETSRGPLVLASRSWHPGVVGIVAGRLVDRYHRPAVVIAVNEEGQGRGSARTISGVNIYEGIAACRGDLQRFGGHAAAAGLTIREEQVPIFRERLGEALAAPLERASGRHLACDAEVEPVGLSPAAVRELDRLGPFGVGNPEPTLVLRNLHIRSSRVVGENHLKLLVRGSRGSAVTAFGYGKGGGEGFALKSPIDVACSLEINVWNETEGVQLRLKDMRASAVGNVATC